MKQTDRPPGSSGRLGAPPGPRLPRPGERVGEYVVLAELGRGTMGAVYRAHDPVGREVALKVLTPENLDPQGLVRFQREGQVLAGLPPHRNVLRVHAMGVHEGLPWLALDLVEGQGLDDVIAERGRLPAGQAAALVQKLCLAVEHVHAAGVLHRDLKLANVLLRAEDAEPVLSDFGLAALEGEERLTRTGDMLGTPLYMSPEQLLGRRREIDRQTDVWSLGVLLYHALTGALPFPARSMSDLARMVQQEDWTPLATHLGRDDPALTMVLGRALAKRKLARYRTAGDMAADLACWPERPRSRAPGSPDWARRLALGLGLLAGLLSVALLVTLFLRADPAALERLTAAASELRLDLSGAGAAPRSTRVAELRQALLAARRHPARARGAAEALLHAVEVDAALRAGDPRAAAARLEAMTPGGARAVLEARLALLRGEAPEADALQALVDDPDEAVAGGARVVLARALRVRDPQAALRLLSRRVDPAIRGEEQAAAQLLLALGTVQVHGAAGLARGREGERLLPELRERARVLLAQALEPPPALEQAIRLLGILGALPGTPRPDPLADRVVELARDEALAPVAARMELFAGLGGAGLLPLQRRGAERFLDHLTLELYRPTEPPRLDLFARALSAAVLLDVDVIPSHLGPLEDGRGAGQFPPGWVGDYLRLLLLASKSADDEEQGRAKRELHRAWAERRFPLGPNHVARAITESVYSSMGADTALAALGEARHVAPENPWVLTQLGIALKAVRRPEEACQAVEEGARHLLEGGYLERQSLGFTLGTLMEGMVEVLSDCGRLERAGELLDEFERRRGDCERARKAWEDRRKRAELEARRGR